MKNSIKLETSKKWETFIVQFNISFSQVWEKENT